MISIFVLALVFAFLLSFSSQEVVAGHSASTKLVFNDSSILNGTTSATTTTTSNTTNNTYGPGQFVTFGIVITNETFANNTQNDTVIFQLGRPDGVIVNFSFAAALRSCLPSCTAPSSPTPRNTTINAFNITFDQSQLGGVGRYNLTWYANSTVTGDIHVASPLEFFNISKNTTLGNTMSIFVNNATGNQTVTYPNALELRGNTTLAASEQTGGITFTLYWRNTTTDFSASLGSGTNVAKSPPLGNGTYQVVYNTTGNANYSSASNSTLFLLVNKGILNLNTFVNNITTNTTTTIYPNGVQLVGNTTGDPTGIDDVTFELYWVNASNSSSNGALLNGARLTSGVGKSGTSLANTTPLVLGNSTYYVVYNTTGGSNWTANSTGASYLNFIIHKGAVNVTLFLNSSAANLTIATNTAVNVTATINTTDTQDAIDLYNRTRIFDSESGFDIPNITNITTWTGDAGTEFNITAVYNASANYTQGVSQSFYIIIESTAPTITFYNKTGGTGGFQGDTGFFSNGSFFNSGDNFTLNINVTDNFELPSAGFNVSIFFNDTFVANFSNSTASAGVRTVWANSSFLIPDGLRDGNYTLNATTLDASGSRGFNRTFLVQIDNTAPTVSLSVSNSKIKPRGSTTVSCDASDSGAAPSGLTTTEFTFTVTKPKGDTFTESCGAELIGEDTNEEGTYTVEFKIKDKVGNEATKNVTFVAEKAGEAAEAGGTPGVVAEEGVVIPVLLPGVPGVALFTVPEHGIREIEITVINRANSVRIRVTKLDDKPASITQEIADKVYEYIEINTENLAADNIDSAKVRFGVPKSWLRDNNVDRNKIFVYRFTTLWEKYAARIIGEDVENVNYIADTPGFSTFAIGGEEKKVVAPTKPPAEEEVITPPPSEEEVVTPPVREEIKPPEKPTDGTTVAAIVLLLLVLIGIVYWKKDVIFGGTKR